MKLSILLIISLLFAAGCATHQPVKPNEANAAPKVESKADATAENNAFKNKIDGQICRRDKEVRSIWTEHMLPNGCKLWYSHYKKKSRRVVNCRNETLSSCQ